MPTAEDFNNIDYDAVMAALSERGLDFTWEYPGVVAIEVMPDVDVWTGLHSFAYGDVNLYKGIEWIGEGGSANVDLEEYETDPDTIAQAWLRWVVAVRATVERSKREITEDIERGTVPADVLHFSQLHDFVDANEYGGFCEDDDTFLYADVFTFDGKGIDNCNVVQTIIDRWLGQGRPEGI